MMEEEETRDQVTASPVHQEAEIESDLKQNDEGDRQADVTGCKEFKHKKEQVASCSTTLEAPYLDPTSIDVPLADAQKDQTMTSETLGNSSSLLTEEQNLAKEQDLAKKHDLANVKIKKEDEDEYYEAASPVTENNAMESEITREEPDKDESSTDNSGAINTTTESSKDSEDSLNSMDAINKFQDGGQGSKTPSECSETSSEKMRGIRSARVKERSAKALPEDGHTGTKPKMRNIRPGFNFEPGARLEAMDYLNKWYSAKIVHVDWDAEEVQIHFEGWNARYDEWLDFQSERLRPAPRHSFRRDSYSESQIRRAGEQVLARWTDCRFYPAQIISSNNNGSYQVLFYDGIKKTVQAINIRDLPATLQDKSKRSKEAAYEKEWSRGQGRRKMERSQSFESDSPTAPKRRLSGNNSTPIQSKRIRHESTSPRLKGQLPSPRSHSSSPASSNTSLSSLGSPITPVLSQLGKKSREPSSSNTSLSSLGSLITPVLSQLVITDKDVGLLREPNRMFAPKEIVIDFDHNKYKCDIAGCGKAFRKGSLLDYHKKYYHIGAKSSSWASAANKALSRSRKRLSTPAASTGVKKSTSTSTPQPAKVQRLRSSAPAALSSKLTRNLATPVSKSNALPMSPVSPTLTSQLPGKVKVSERLKAQEERKVKDDTEKKESRQAIRKSLERSSIHEKAADKGKPVEVTKKKKVPTATLR